MLEKTILSRHELYSLPFYQILGAPLIALVQADAQAAQISSEFIETIGFIGTVRLPAG